MGPVELCLFNCGDREGGKRFSLRTPCRGLGTPTRVPRGWEDPRAGHPLHPQVQGGERWWDPSCCWESGVPSARHEGGVSGMSWRWAPVGSKGTPQKTAPLGQLATPNDQPSSVKGVFNSPCPPTSEFRSIWEKRQCYHTYPRGKGGVWGNLLPWGTGPTAPGLRFSWSPKLLTQISYRKPGGDCNPPHPMAAPGVVAMLP